MIQKQESIVKTSISVPEKDAIWAVTKTRSEAAAEAKIEPGGPPSRAAGGHGNEEMIKKARTPLVKHAFQCQKVTWGDTQITTTARKPLVKQTFRCPKGLLADAQMPKKHGNHW